ncbi:aldehyde dehydrogenase family protein [Phytohabitans flavus]|uniref:aldehyde dehydrogenase family protein n=1 Tax=Phytohabitans flavus TaxID=1076124 RepID=UPI0036368D43
MPSSTATRARSSTRPSGRWAHCERASWRGGVWTEPSRRRSRGFGVAEEDVAFSAARASEPGGAVSFVDGEWREASGTPIAVTDPASGEEIASVPSATAAEVGDALDAARRAQREWSRLPATTRGDHLRAIAGVFADHREALADSLVREVGKPKAQALGEVEFAIGFLRYNADWDRRIEGEILPGDVPGEVIHLLRAPVGVVGAICPWNFPLAVLCRKIAPALLTGNTVVAKPSEVTPLTTLHAFRLVAEHAPLPPGVLNLVTGGRETGAALVADPRTSMVSFTGHRDTGKSVMATAAERLTRVSLELGGKAPAIVWRDADLDLAVASIVDARHFNAGQVCTSAERVLVHESIVDDFTGRYVAAVEALRVGHPSGEVDVGPMVSAAQHRKTSAALETALREGATVLTGGGTATVDGYAGGYWFTPTVLGGVRPGMSVMTEETFGPVTPIYPVADLDEALAIANDSRYGLSAYIFSRDYGTVMRTVDDLDFGEIYINRTLGESVHAHHAGFKESGIGGEDGKWGLLRYTQIKTAYHHFG